MHSEIEEALLREKVIRSVGSSRIRFLPFLFDEKYKMSDIGALLHIYKDMLEDQPESLYIPVRDRDQQPIETLKQEVRALKQELAEFRHRLAPIIKEFAGKSKDIEDRALVIGWEIGRLLAPVDDVKDIYMELEDEYTTFHIIVTAGKFPEVNRKVSAVERTILSVFPEDGVRFRTHDERGFTAADYEGCVAIERTGKAG